MSQNIVNEMYFLFGSVAVGLIITFVYDFILIGRRVIRHNLFFVSVEDFVFWVVCALAVFYMLYEENNGILRWFAVFGAAVGMFFYKKIIGMHFVHVMSIIVRKQIYIAKKSASFAFAPIRWISVKIKAFLRFLKRKCKKILKLVKKKLTVFIKMLKITLCKH